MHSLLASTSKRVFSTTLRSSRFFATQTQQTSTIEQSSSSSSPVSPLPGSAVLPEAFRAPSSSSSSSSSSSPSSTPTSRDTLSFSTPRRTSSPLRPQPYKLSVYSTRNNTILTLSTSPLGSSATPQDPHVPIAWVSAGSAGYKGAARGTYDAAVEVSLKMFEKVSNLIEPPMLQGGVRQKLKGPKPTELEIVWKGFGQGRDAVFRTLMGAEGDQVRSLVKRVTDATPLKIGGTRAKKRRVI